MYRLWYSTETLAQYIKAHTSLSRVKPETLRLYESDANNSANFHRMPDHIKKILYLDAPDLIVEREGEPIFTVEVSQEAGTGHNAFQRFPRIAASAENEVPALYVYPQAIFIRRGSDPSQRWDKINPNIFKAMERIMRIYDIPALLFYFPTTYPKSPVGDPKGKLLDPDHEGCPLSSDPEMQDLFQIVDLIVDRAGRRASSPRLVNARAVAERRDWMQREFVAKAGDKRRWSPETATAEVETGLVIEYLRKYSHYCDAELLRARPVSVVYQVDAGIRGDPYPGALAALDYLLCRTGKTYEDRDKNLVLAWGRVEVQNGKLTVVSSRGADSSVCNFVGTVRKVRHIPSRCLLASTFDALRGPQIPRYYMQVRYGCTFTKVKEIRCYAYFADAILFHDGALWREG